MAEEIYMRQAIELAKKGVGRVDPNPLVGAVIVKDGKVVGRGYHEEYGKLHAERNAIADMKANGYTGEGADIYVTLEPCAHYGKTPPCTEAIIENKFARVIIGSRDPNPEVSGLGVRQLRAAGIEVVEDFLKDDCDSLNAVFFHYITSGRPFVLMKYAMTLDGKIASKTGMSRWISGEESRAEVHRYRSKYVGIMAGIGTVLADDPMLNTRIEGGRDPVRIICDSKMRIPPDCRIVKTADKYRTILVFTEENKEKAEILKKNGVELLKIEKDRDGRISLEALMYRLGEMKIASILAEGGGTLNYSLLAGGLVNEIKVFIAPKIFGGKARSPVEGEGVETPDEAFEFELTDTQITGKDICLTYRPVK